MQALAAAASFGVTTPRVQHFGVSIGPFTTAALLYAGASGLALALGGTAGETPLNPRDLPRLGLVALFGAFLAPGEGGATLMGGLLVAGATLGWALDNTLSRPLSELDPGRVVAWKGGLGAVLSLLAALTHSHLHTHTPRWHRHAHGEDVHHQHHG